MPPPGAPTSTVVATLLLAMCAQAVAARSSRWWFNLHSGAYADEAVRLARRYAGRALTGVYMYDGVGVAGRVSFNDTAVRAAADPLLEMGLTVGVVVAVDTGVIENGTGWKRNGSSTLATLAAHAAACNITSLMLDFEPDTSSADVRAEYVDFVTAMATATHAQGVELDICVSSWGVLDNFTAFAGTGVDGMMSMASTYFGTNITGNEEWVLKEQAQGVSASQLRVGIGSANAVWQKWNYNWTEPRFDTFVSWLEQHSVQHIDLWRTDLDTTNATNGTAPWMIDRLETFLLGHGRGRS